MLCGSKDEIEYVIVSIADGIKRSKFAILANESITGSTPLPIWHNISYEEVFEFSPTLAGVYAYSTAEYSINDICQALKLTLEKVPV